MARTERSTTGRSTTERSTPAAGVGSPAALRAANTGRLQAALDRRGPLTQAQLSRETGLSPATVSNLVKQLRAQHLVRTAPVTSSGRRATLVTPITSEAGQLGLGIDIGRRHLTVTLARRDGEVIEESTSSRRNDDPQDTMARVALAVASSLARAGLDASGVLGAGVALPGAIDPIRGRVAVASTLPEWAGVPVRDRLSRALAVPVWLGNDANCGALAEARWGAEAGVDDLIYVKVGSGIGAGVVSGGRLVAGVEGAAGELGHMPVDPGGPLCRCGNRGCLESYASTRVMLEAIATHHGEQSVDGLIALVQAGDPASRRVVNDAGFALGGVLAAAVTMLNPAAVVIGGPLAPLGETWLEPVRRGLLRNAGVLTAATRVTASTLGDRAVALGGCALAFERSAIRSGDVRNQIV